VYKREFKDILEKGKKLFSDHYSISFIKNNKYFKASVVVSKKISKLAPERNYQKRISRELIKRVFSIELPYSCIFFVKKNLRSTPFTDLEKEISLISKKIQ
jgi:ribonuclease P protein component